MKKFELNLEDLRKLNDEASIVAGVLPTTYLFTCR